MQPDSSLSFNHDDAKTAQHSTVHKTAQHSTEESTVQCRKVQHSTVQKTAQKTAQKMKAKDNRIQKTTQQNTEQSTAKLKKNASAAQPESLTRRPRTPLLSLLPQCLQCHGRRPPRPGPHWGRSDERPGPHHYSLGVVVGGEGGEAAHNGAGRRLCRSDY